MDINYLVFVSYGETHLCSCICALVIFLNLPLIIGYPGESIIQCMTELITNNAAAALVIPIASTGSKTLGINPQPFYLAIMLAVRITGLELKMYIVFHCCCYCYF